MESKVEVIDRDGWRRVYPLDKNLIYIGSGSQNDIILAGNRGAGVAPRHIQLIPRPSGGVGYRLINLSDQDIPLGQENQQIVPPRSFVDITAGQQLLLGEFKLVFHGGGPSNGWAPAIAGQPASASPTAAISAEPTETLSQSIALSINLADTNLSPARPLEGRVMIKNIGQALGVQFILELEGLESDFYELEPGPVLFPNAEAELVLRLHHPHQPEPQAGPHRIAIRAAAPDAYPNERVTVGKMINILPYFSHQISLEPRR